MFSKDWRQALAATFPTEFVFPIFILKLLYRPGRKIYWVSLGSKIGSGNLENFMHYILPRVTNDFVLITSDGDRSVPLDIAPEAVCKIVGSNKIKAWYSQNAILGKEYEKLKFIPIGLDFHTARSDGYANSKIETYLAKTQSRQIRRNVLICDCLARPTSKLRSNFKREFDLLQSDAINVPVNLSESELWNLYCQAGNVLSITGNGLDCHRTWEAYFLGCNIFCDDNAISDSLKLFGIRVFRSSEEVFLSMTQELDPIVTRINKWNELRQKIERHRNGEDVG